MTADISGSTRRRLVTLRQVCDADLARVWTLNEAALPAVNSVPLEFFRAYVDSPQAVFQIAVDNATETLVGFLLALRPGVDYSSENYQWFDRNFRSFLYVDRIVVDPSAQSAGLGRRFYSGLVALANDELAPAKRICCEVNIKPRNDRSLRFHQRFGFRKCFEQEAEGAKKVVRLLTYDIPQVQ